MSIREEGLFQVDRTKGRIKVVEHWIDNGKRVVTIANDNVLWRGRVAPPSVHDENTTAIRALNEKIVADERVDHVLLPIRDGVTLACVR